MVLGMLDTIPSPLTLMPESADQIPIRALAGLPVVAFASPLQARAEAVQRQAARWSCLDEPSFTTLVADTRAGFAWHGMQVHTIDVAAALAVEAARRAVGLSAFTGQVMAALAISSHALAEMAAGEGKSLAIALAAAIGALAGLPVHVLAANDDRVGRDAERFRPFFGRLGLAVGTVPACSETLQRRGAYQCPVVYATAREVVFDHLRDRLRRDPNDGSLARWIMALTSNPAEREPLLRGLGMAIIDDAHSVLIDDADMPRMLSRAIRDSGPRDQLSQAWLLSARLTEGQDFRRCDAGRTVQLTDRGRAELASLAEPLAAVWKIRLHRERIVAQALVVRHVLERNRDYLVIPACAGAPARVELIDAATGRITESRCGFLGLHGLVALKEGLQPEGELATIERTTFQRFFRCYHHLGGAGSQLVEARRELWHAYGLGVVCVPPRKPSQRAHGPARCFVDDDDRDRAVLVRARRLTRQRRPVLIGTDSVAHGQRLSTLLNRASLAHDLLDARCGADDAERIARAGEPGRITVLTHMAGLHMTGRCIDIALHPVARLAGGLHVIACQHDPSMRLDRLLLGRAARRGDPGSGEVWLSLASCGALGRRAGRLGGWPRRLLARLAGKDGLPIPSWLPGLLERAVQRDIERSLAG